MALIETLKKQRDNGTSPARWGALLLLYVLNLLVALDVVANTILGGHPTLTVSARLRGWLGGNPAGWRYKVANAICRALSRHRADHCTALPRTAIDWGQPWCRALWE